MFVTHDTDFRCKLMILFIVNLKRKIAWVVHINVKKLNNEGRGKKLDFKWGF